MVVGGDPSGRGRGRSPRLSSPVKGGSPVPRRAPQPGWHPPASPHETWGAALQEAGGAACTTHLPACTGQRWWWWRAEQSGGQGFPSREKPQPTLSRMGKKNRFEVGIKTAPWGWWLRGWPTGAAWPVPGALKSLEAAEGQPAACLASHTCYSARVSLAEVPSVVLPIQDILTMALTVCVCSDKFVMKLKFCVSSWVVRIL